MLIKLQKFYYILDLQLKVKKNYLIKIFLNIIFLIIEKKNLK